MPWRPLPIVGGPPPVRVDEPLARLLRHLGVPESSALSTLTDAWAELVGPTMAEHTDPVTVHHGTLVVRVDDPAWAAQLRWMQAQLVERLAATPAFESVQRIELRVGSGTPRRVGPSPRNRGTNC